MSRFGKKKEKRPTWAKSAFIFGWFASCSGEVSILLIGKQQSGSVSIRLGLLCVRKGFM